MIESYILYKDIIRKISLNLSLIIIYTMHMKGIKNHIYLRNDKQKYIKSITFKTIINLLNIFYILKLYFNNWLLNLWFNPSIF